VSFPKPTKSPHLVPFDGSFRALDAPTRPPKDRRDKEANRARLAERLLELEDQQRRLYATDSWSLLLVFQAMDAAGKDGTIRAVLSGVDPTGCQVYSFKQPSSEELDHDFLWRTSRCLPERGRIGVFNRSYYEEVIVVRVHPELLGRQKLPGKLRPERIFERRYESIREHERHLTENGTVILKFWLNVSKEEQRRRFLARIDEPESNWKFAEGDVAERARWKDYMRAYERALRETSRPWAPWYAIPSDAKHYARVAVADVVVKALRQLDLRFPKVDDARRRVLARMRRKLVR
jgi:PPK2 family polyphosphate:nucleotide phosphotransferase